MSVSSLDLWTVSVVLHTYSHESPWKKTLCKVNDDKSLYYYKESGHHLAFIPVFFLTQDNVLCTNDSSVKPKFIISEMMYVCLHICADTRGGPCKSQRFTLECLYLFTF